VLVVVVAAAGGQLARAGVVRAKPTRRASAGRVVLGGSFRAIRRGVEWTFASGDYLVTTHGDDHGYGYGDAPILINDALGTTAALDPLDSGCDVAAFGPPWLVMNCGGATNATTYNFELYSLADGTRQTLTRNPGLTCNVLCNVGAVGSYWIEWDLNWYHFPETTYFQNIQTGELRDDPTNATTFPDLNSPTLAERTCPGVRLIYSNADYGDGPADANPWGWLTSEGQFALVTTNTEKVFLERCGTHMRRLLPTGGSDRDYADGLVSNASVIVWQPARNRLTGLFLPSLQKFTMPLPRAVAATERGYKGGEFALALTSEALYVNEGVALWRTASLAALPRNVTGPQLTRSGSTLTCVPGSWLSAASFSYEWRVNGSKEQATNATLVLGNSPQQRTVNCSVTASNPTGTTTASSAPLYLR
jgi:hypothetical protein